MTINRRGLVLAGLLLAPAAGAARAQTLADYDYENLSFRGIGVSWGYIWPTKVKATPLYSLRLDLGYLGPGLRIAPTLSYWNSEMRLSELERFASSINSLPALQRQGATVTAADLGPVRWSDLALDVDGEWVVGTPTGVLAYAGLGVGLHALNGRGAAIANSFVEDLLDNIAPALTGLAGLEYPLGPRFRIFSEMRLTAMGDIQYGGLRAGAALMAPGHAPPPAPAAPPPPPGGGTGGTPGGVRSGAPVGAAASGSTGSPPDGGAGNALGGSADNALGGGAAHTPGGGAGMAGGHGAAAPGGASGISDGAGAGASGAGGETGWRGGWR